MQMYINFLSMFLSDFQKNTISIKNALSPQKYLSIPVQIYIFEQYSPYILHVFMMQE